MFRLRFIPTETDFKFMKGRFAGVAISAFLSVASIILFFHPGLNYGIDFVGGIMVELRTEGPADTAGLRAGLTELGLGEIALQEFGGPSDVLIRIERQPGDDAAQMVAVAKVRAALGTIAPKAELRRVEVVGPRVSAELFQTGSMAVIFALLAIMLYIWFRFEWQFGVGAVVTLVLDITKTVGLYAVTGMEFNLTAIAAVLTILGYSVNDKVVVYDRMRENLRKYKAMPLRDLIDLSINQTLTRTIYTGLTVVLAMLPMAIAGGSAVQDFGITMIFGVIVGTSSSIFISAPILLVLGEGRLRRGMGESSTAAPAPVARTKA